MASDSRPTLEGIEKTMTHWRHHLEHGDGRDGVYAGEQLEPYVETIGAVLAALDGITDYDSPEDPKEYYVKQIDALRDRLRAMCGDKWGGE